MITGYNTDVRHQKTVFHVQTEDKGVSNPFIESVVYVGGQVLAAKRAGYADLLDEGQGEEAISARMDQQHRMMIAAIRAGKLDTKLEELASGRRHGTNSDARIEAAATPSLLAQAREEEDGPTLDQVILDYLTSEAEREQLSIDVNGSELRQGEEVQLTLRTTSGRSGLAVSGARISVRMISTVRRPVVLGEGITDEEGRLDLTIAVPTVGTGSAAIIITATSVVGSAELKHIL